MNNGDGAMDAARACAVAAEACCSHRGLACCCSGCCVRRDGALPAAGALVFVRLSADFTLLPGLIDAHAHPTFPGTFDFDVSADECATSTAATLRTCLRAGFTSLHSAASTKLGVEVALRAAVHRGDLLGPRWRTAGPELTPPGGLGEGRTPSIWEGDCFGLVCADGPALVTAVAACAAAGADAVKLNISGEEMTPAGDDVVSTYGRQEVDAVVAAARAAGVRVSAHARGHASVCDAAAAGVDILYHLDFAGPTGVAALLAAPDMLLAPSLGFDWHPLVASQLKARLKAP